MDIQMYCRSCNRYIDIEESAEEATLSETGEYVSLCWLCVKQTDEPEDVVSFDKPTANGEANLRESVEREKRLKAILAGEIE